MAEGTTNYTDAMVETMTQRYKEAPTRETVEALADEMGKSTRSVISKLSNLGIYQAPERTTKAGKPIVRKSELVAKIGAAFGIEVPSLEKASKVDLEALAKAVGE